MIRRALTAFLLLAALGGQAFAQACLPVPSLPDIERRKQYSLPVASTGPLAVGFAIYGDATDFTDWIQVFINGTLTTAYTLASPSGSVATLCRPITDAQITFTTAQTGTVQIVGARRPRRTSQFTENRGVAARDINQVVSDLVAQNRETWDWRNRVIQGVPGDNFGVLSPAAVRANTIFGFDSNGLPTYLPLGPTISATAGSAFNTRGLAAVASISGTVQFIQTAGFGVVGDGGGALYIRAGGSTPGGFQSADGAWWAITGPVLWAKQFGAVCDVTTDDSTALQNLINRGIALGADTKGIGLCRIATGLTINGSLRFGGTATRAFQLVPDAFVTAITLATTSPISLENFTIAGSSTGTVGIVCNGISSSVGDGNVRSIFSGLWLESLVSGLTLSNCGQFTLRDSYFNQNFTNLVINNPSSCDAGDNAFINNTFITGTASASVIVYCGGGQRFMGNKWNGNPAATAVQYRLGATLTNSFSSAHLFVGNSMEGFAQCFDIARAAGTGTLANVTIAKNEMVCGIGVNISVSGEWVYNVEIDNQWNGNLAGSTNIYAQVDGMAGFRIGGQLLTSVLNAVALGIGTTTSGGVAGPISKGVAGGTWAASVLNGTISVTCSAACN